MATTNPFLLVHQTLWTLLNANTAFVTLVPTGCQIDYSPEADDTGADQSPDKEGMTTKDFPQVRIVTTGGSGPTESSNTTFLRRDFAVQIDSGSRLLEHGMEVEWEVLRALSNWKTSMEALKWNSKSFVSDCSLLQSRAKMENVKGFVGWTTLWAGSIAMFFTTSDLPP
jgi:hypothetical protein